MATYTFIESSLLNTAILPDNPNRFISYTTKTTYNALVPNVTSFLPSVNDRNQTLEGEINWKRETFSIAGLATRWDELKCKPDGIIDSTREWRWIGKRYFVKYSKNVWLARNGSPEGAIDATFTIRKNRIMHPSSPATIQFSGDVSSRDRLFLLLVMIYCETRRQERKEKATVAVAGGRLAAALPNAHSDLLRN